MVWVLKNTCSQGPVKKSEEFQSLFWNPVSLGQAMTGYKTSVRSLPAAVPSIKTACSIFLWWAWVRGQRKTSLDTHPDGGRGQSHCTAPWLPPLPLRFGAWRGRSTSCGHSEPAHSLCSHAPWNACRTGLGLGPRLEQILINIRAILCVYLDSGRKSVGSCSQWMSRPPERISAAGWSWWNWTGWEPRSCGLASGVPSYWCMLYLWVLLPPQSLF